MSMDIADSVKNQGLIGFLRLVDGGPEISLEFKKGEYSKAVKVTLDGHVVTAYLTLVPADGTPNMALTITKMAHTAAFAEQLQAVGGETLEEHIQHTITEKPKIDAAKAQLEADAAVLAEANALADAAKAKAKSELEASGASVPGAAPTGEKAPVPEEKKSRFQK